MQEILKVLVGSRAHGLADESSDYDYRAVFLTPTRELLSVGNKPVNSTWIEGNEDNTAWELKHFLSMALQNNPTVLEVFVAPIEVKTYFGEVLRNLLPNIINPKLLLNSHLGYAKNQKNKLLAGDWDLNKDRKSRKYTSAWLRVTYQALHYFRHGEYIIDFRNTEVYKNLLDIRTSKDYTQGEAVNLCNYYEGLLLEFRDYVNDKKADLELVNDFVISVRKANLLAEEGEFISE
jgi:hypothetical protein